MLDDSLETPTIAITRPWEGRTGSASTAQPERAGTTTAVLEEGEEAPASFTAQMAKLARFPSATVAQRRIERRRRARQALTRALCALDLATGLLALFVARRLAVSHTGLRLAVVSLQPRTIGAQPRALLLAAVMLALWPVTFGLFQLYRSERGGGSLSAWRAALAVCAAALVADGAWACLFGREAPFSLSFLLLDLACAVGLRLALRLLLPRSLFRWRTLVIGQGQPLAEALATLDGGKAPQLKLVGALELDGETQLGPASPSSLRALVGEERDAPLFASALHAERVLIALPAGASRRAQRLVSGLAHLPLDIALLPDVASLSGKPAVELVGGLPAVALTRSAIPAAQATVKRLCDLVVSGLALAALWPLMLLIAVAIRLDSPGPALFTQERVGQGNRRFTMIKFRTMYTDAERRAAEVSKVTAKGIVHKQRNDPRVTPFGALLRRTSLDELPQLVNVLRGDMSLIGPRPELPWLVEGYHAWQYQRLQAPQGITGWWQVNGRSDRVMHLHTEDDLYYVRNYSLWLDLKILLMTARTVFGGKGAY